LSLRGVCGEHIGLLRIVAKQAVVAGRLRHARLRALTPTPLGDDALVIAKAVKQDGGLLAHVKTRRYRLAGLAY
jgi:hypothetical protein